MEELMEGVFELIASATAKIVPRFDLKIKRKWVRRIATVVWYMLILGIALVAVFALLMLLYLIFGWAPTI